MDSFKEMSTEKQHNVELAVAGAGTVIAICFAFGAWSSPAHRKTFQIATAATVAVTVIAALILVSIGAGKTKKSSSGDDAAADGDAAAAPATTDGDAAAADGDAAAAPATTTGDAAAPAATTGGDDSTAAPPSPPPPHPDVLPPAPKTFTHPTDPPSIPPHPAHANAPPMTQAIVAASKPTPSREPARVVPGMKPLGPFFFIPRQFPVVSADNTTFTLTDGNPHAGTIIGWPGNPGNAWTATLWYTMGPRYGKHKRADLRNIGDSFNVQVYRNLKPAGLDHPQVDLHNSAGIVNCEVNIYKSQVTLSTNNEQSVHPFPLIKLADFRPHAFAVTFHDGSMVLQFDGAVIASAKFNSFKFDPNPNTFVCLQGFSGDAHIRQTVHSFYVVPLKA